MLQEVVKEVLEQQETDAVGLSLLATLKEERKVSEMERGGRGSGGRRRQRWKLMRILILTF